MTVIAHGGPAVRDLPGIEHRTLLEGPEAEASSLWLQTLEPEAGTPPHSHPTEEADTVHLLRAETELRLLAWLPDPDPTVYDPDGDPIELPW